MAQAIRGFGAFRAFLEMVKFEHSIFALPFAMVGMVWGSVWVGGSGWPGWKIFGLILLAMVSCRSAAMAFNRIVDRHIDAKNPRTQMRHLPAGLLSLRQANLFFYGFCAVFFVSAFLLNSLAGTLSPIALGVTLFYSLTKRFTPLCHLVLGFSLGIAPAAAWIAVTGELHPVIVPMVAAVMFWTAGFDVIYSLQDEEFDRSEGLRSLPETLGKTKALTVSRIFHAFAVISLGTAIVLVGAGIWAWAGLVFVAALLGYEQSLVKPTDLSKVNMAFFTVNGFVSIGVFVFILIDVLFRKAGS